MKAFRIARIALAALAVAGPAARARAEDTNFPPARLSREQTGDPSNAPPVRASTPRGRPPGEMRPAGWFAVLDRVLTEDQRVSFRTAMARQHGKMQALQESLRAARQELQEASLSTNLDESNVRSKALEVGRLEAEAAVLRASALSQVKPPLASDQIEKLRNLPLPMDDRTAGPPPDPRRGSNRVLPGPRDENDLPLPPKPAP